ncbi:MAG: acyl-ACP--UDP-N-acetylglucosamine O-acyltransferase [Alphaproteobacteria bacterium]|nr:acyl-ACP--UDP-N-acetylglucosamine O-acyltransferase [Alphaproteobacteria bacterium]
MPEIHPTALVAPGARLAESVRIGPFSTIGAEVTLGPGVEVMSHVVIDGRTVVGEGCRIFPGATVGLAPQDLKYANEPTELRIGARCLIREHVTIHRGTKGGGGITSVGDDCFLMACVHVAHDCHLGNRVIIANNAVMGGHVEIGDNAVIGGTAALHQFVRIGRHAMVGGASAVEGDVIPFGSVLGNRAWLAGLNLIGLKRRGFPRTQIHALRGAFRLVFGAEGTLESRLDAALARWPEEALVQEVVAFMRAPSKRPLVLPGRAGAIDVGDADEANGA